MENKDWFLKDYKKAITAKGRVLPAVQAVLVRDAVRDSASRDIQYLHPSSLCKRDWCPRSSWYVIKDQFRQKESAEFGRLNIFAEGNAIHDKWQKWLGRAGILEGNWNCQNCDHTVWSIGSEGMKCPSCGSPRMKYREVPITNEEHHLLGHADGIINDANGKAVLEIKSVGMGTIRYEAPELFAEYSKGNLTLDGLWKKIKTPLPAHLRQVSLYMYCLGIHDAVILYEWKPTQEVKEFSIKLQMEQIDSILVGCRSIKTALDNGTSVMRPYSAQPEDSRCKSCDFKTKCWSDYVDHQETAGTTDVLAGEVHVEVRHGSTPSRQDPPSSRSGRTVRLGFDG